MKGKINYMGKELTKRKMLRRKYKHCAAALAGVAIMAGTTLHGIPSVKAADVDNPSTSPPVTTEQMTPIKNDKTDTIVINPSTITDQGNRSDRNAGAAPEQRNKDKDYHPVHDRYKHERWTDHGLSLYQRIAWYNDSSNKFRIYNNNANAVDIAIAAADSIGFDTYKDKFSLIGQSGSQSIVRVVHDGNNYDITVDHLSNDNWLVSFVNQTQ
jgi:hypothetical protein